MSKAKGPKKKINTGRWTKDEVRLPRHVLNTYDMTTTHRMSCCSRWR